MKKIYTSLKALVLVLTLGLSTASFAQLCGPVLENFSSGPGGFIGDFSYDAPGQRLIRRNVIGTAVYSITTPTYRLADGNSTMGVGFTLDGSDQVARADIKIMYISTLTSEMTTFNLGQFVPNYGGGTTANVCAAVDVNSLPGFPTTNRLYKFRIELSANSGTGLVTQTVTFDNFRTTGTVANIGLPVAFVGFDAKKAANGAQLVWKVAAEDNVNRYEVERSTDGRNFVSVASIGAGKRDTYTYFDPAATSTVYYRIKNVDNDGRFKYSSVARLVNGRSSIVVKAFPQPVVSQLTVQHPDTKGAGLLTLSTADGRVVKSLRPATGSLQTAVEMSNLQKGLYLIRFDDGEGNVETLKVIKQ